MNDLSAKRELAYEAKDIIESKAFEQARTDMREALVSELMTAQSRERREDIIAEIRVLGNVFGRLKKLINDYNSGVRAQARGQSQSSYGASRG